MHPVYTFKRDIRFGSLFCISYMPYALQFELPLGMMSFFMYATCNIRVLSHSNCAIKALTYTVIDCAPSFGS